MKKTSLLIILCASLLAGCSGKDTSPVEEGETEVLDEDSESATEEVGSIKPDEDPLSPTEVAYQMYAEKVQELEDDYGVFNLDIYPAGIPDNTWYTANGLSYLNLTDFDNDGIEELVAVCGRYGMFQIVHVYTADGTEIKEIYCNTVGGGGSPVMYQVEINEKDGKYYLLRQTASPTYDVYEMRDGIMKSLGEVEGGGLTFYNDPDEIEDQVEESRNERNSYIFNFSSEFCPGAPDALLAAINEVKTALSLETQDTYEIRNSSYDENFYYEFLYRGCTLVWSGIDEVTGEYKLVYTPVFTGEDTKKEYAIDDLDGDGTLELILREGDKDLYVIRRNDWELELSDDEELIASAKAGNETFTAIPDKEIFTSPYSMDMDDYFVGNMTIKDAIAINGDDYEVGNYKGCVIVKYNDIGFIPSISDPDKLTFDMNSTIEQVIIFGDRRIYGATYGHLTFPELKEALEKSHQTAEKEPEKIHNDNEDRDEYIFETESWSYRFRFTWLDNPETSPCTTVEVTVKEDE